MKFRIIIGLLIAMGISLNGCAPSNYTLMKIPDTQANRQAFRECQHTLAVATGYDSDGYKRLFKNCTATIDSTSEITQGYPTANPVGCQKIQDDDYDLIYYFCK